MTRTIVHLCRDSPIIRTSENNESTSKPKDVERDVNAMLQDSNPNRAQSHVILPSTESHNNLEHDKNQIYQLPTQQQ